MKHGLLHILGCLIPIALIFILPALGFGSGVTYTAFIVLMFACHLFMMGGHGHAHGGHDGARSDSAPQPEHGKKGGDSCH